jgi:hypothetical protein
MTKPAACTGQIALSSFFLIDHAAAGAPKLLHRQSLVLASTQSIDYISHTEQFNPGVPGQFINGDREHTKQFSDT